MQIISDYSVLESAQFIYKYAENVWIDLDKIDTVSTAIIYASKIGKIPSWKDSALNPKDKTDATLNWYLRDISILHKLWESNKPAFQVTYKGITYKSYWAFCACLNRALESGVPITSSSYILKSDPEELKNVFIDDNGLYIPLVDERVYLLKQAAAKLETKYQGKFANCIVEASYDAITLLNLIVSDFPSFFDVSWFKGQPVAFLKRAQILIADIWACFEGEGYGDISNIDSLTMFADYRVPQVLHHLGLLSYSQDLIDIIHNEIEIPSGSQNEIEIRGCSIWAVQLLIEKINHIEPSLKINSVLVDYYLWELAQEYKEKGLTFHRTRSIFY